MADRFSKKALTEYLQSRIDNLQNAWGFDPRNGTAQIASIATDRMRTNPIPSFASAKEPAEIHLEAAHRAYGEFQELQIMAEHFDLQVHAIHQDLVLTRTKTVPRRVRYRLRSDMEEAS